MARILSASVVVSSLLLALVPARADFCLQLNGGSFSGDIGFFRFAGKLPTTAGAIAPLAGRAAGLSPAFGAAVVAKDETYVEIGATFFIDATQGQFDVAFSPPDATTGSGQGSYGSYGTGTSVTVKKVQCSKEP